MPTPITLPIATDPKSTLTLARKHKRTVVLLDVAIPGGDAFEVAGKVLKTLPATSRRGWSE
jgi:DNA-binding response OmpR family regulator